MQNMIHPAFLLLLLGAALLPIGRPRSLAALAAVTSGLGLAGLRSGPTLEGSAPAPGFAAVEAALLAVGAALAIAAALAALRRAGTPTGVAGSAAAAATGGIGVALSGAPCFAAAPAGAFVVALGTVVGVGLLLVVAGRRTVRVDQPVGDSPAPLAGVAGIGAGAMLAAVGPGAGLVFLGTILAAAGGWHMRRAAGSRPLPIAPLLTLVLIPAWWLMRTIAGPEGLAIASLADQPWSPAAERLLAGVLLLAAWGTSGLWPLHGEEPAGLTTMVAAMLIVRVAIPAVPDGLEHWRALVLPVVVAGLWHAVFTQRRAAAVAALAWVGLATVDPAGEAGAGLILVGGLAMDLGERLSRGGHMIGGFIRAGAVLLVGVGALLAAEAGLRAEVVYTVLAAGALAAAAGRGALPQARTASEPRATAPSA